MTTGKSLWKRIDDARRQGRLSAAISSHFGRSLQIVLSARYVIRQAGAETITLHCPDYVVPEREDQALVKRIFAAFKRMKAVQSQQPGCYLPSAMWQRFLNNAYANLVSGLKDRDPEAFHMFLANFGTWKQDTAVESSAFIRDHMRSHLGRLYLQNRVFHHQLKIWKWFYNGRKPIGRLTYPRYGNQAGAFIDGVFVGMGSFFNEIYGSLLSELLRDIVRPVVAELGAGYGKFSHFTLRDIKESTFLDFDLPETLCLASYYLMKAYPDKKALLYGEDEYTPDAHGKYDLIFMPSWEIAKVGLETVDLFINKNSLGEMTREAVGNYVHYITKATRFFFHMNHETAPVYFDDTERGLLGYEYPVPGEQFTLLWRYPDMGHLLGQGFPDFSKDIFTHLYQRKASGRRGALA